MPFVNITIYEGQPDVCQLPREAVWVVFNEVTPPGWYVAGNPGKK